jgi:hypothetical protein
MPLLILIVGLMFHCLTFPALAQDCNARCCRTIRVPPFDKKEWCDPACKTSCELHKAARIPVPHAPSLWVKVHDAMQDYCAAGFQVINNAVILYQGTYAAGSERLLNEARDILIRGGLIPASDFHNVDIRWARLTGEGQAPDRNVVLINEKYLSANDLYSTATTLGHEMIHIAQYRRMTTDGFKCEYSKAYVSCKASNANADCQDMSHPLEAEAYRFNQQHNLTIARHVRQAGYPLPEAIARQLGGPSMSYLCVTPQFSCQFPNPAPMGTPCQCQHAGGFAIGNMR